MFHPERTSFDTAGIRTTSTAIGRSRSACALEDATPVARLREAGAIILGKTNVPTIRSGVQTNNPVFGRTNNPWDLRRTPGGSSGGAAAAVSAGLSSLDLGSDIGGSIRIPAHFCGVYGPKTTAGRVAGKGHARARADSKSPSGSRRCCNLRRSGRSPALSTTSARCLLSNMAAIQAQSQAVNSVSEVLLRPSCASQDG